MKSHLLSGAIGALTVILLIIVLCICCEPFNYKPIYIINPSKVIETEKGTNNIEFTCSQIDVLQDLENKGVLLSPHEYTSHISSFYTTLITFLIGLFVLFTVGSIFSIKFSHQKEIDDAKNDLNNREEKIKENLKENIRTSLLDLISDSISFKESVVNSIYGLVEEDLITKSEKETIEKKLNSIEEDINLLYESLSDIADKESAKEEIE